MDYILGLDLGQASDYTALAILERREQADDAGRIERRYGCRGLKRWALGTPYPAIVADVAKIVKSPPLRDSILVVDATGVGRPVVDMFRQAKLPVKLQAAVITAGQKESLVDGYHHVAKTILISGVQVLLQQRRLQFAPSLRETDTLVKELHNYRVKVTEAANEVFNARTGEHDDLVLALALACWWGERRVREFTWW